MYIMYTFVGVYYIYVRERERERRSVLLILSAAAVLGVLLLRRIVCLSLFGEARIYFSFLSRALLSVSVGAIVIDTRGCKK